MTNGDKRPLQAQQSEQTSRGISTIQRGAAYERFKAGQAAIQAALPKPKVYTPVLTTIEEKYTERVPKSYVRNGQVQRSWYKLSSKTQAKLLSRTRSKDLVSFERIRTVERPESAIITEQRAQVEEQAKEGLKAAEPVLLPKRVPFTPRKFREEFRLYGEEVKKGVSEFVAGFETQVARFAPLYGKPEYVAKAEAEAKVKIQEEISQLDSKISGYQERIKYYQNKIREKRKQGKDVSGYKESINKYEDKIDVLEDEKRVWEKGLKKEAPSMIKEYFTGYTEKYAEAKGRQEEAKQEYKAALKKYETKLESLSGLSPIDYAKARAKLPEILQRSLPTTKQYTKQFEEQQKVRDTELKKWEAANPGEKLVRDASGNVVGVESKLLGDKSFTYESYVKELDRLQKVAPIPVYKNIITGEVSSFKEKPSDKLWQKGYSTPQGKFLETQEEINRYIKENKIPTTSPEKIKTAEELKSFLEGDYYRLKDFRPETTSILFGRIKERSTPLIKFFNYPLSIGGPTSPAFWMTGGLVKEKQLSKIKEEAITGIEKTKAPALMKDISSGLIGFVPETVGGLALTYGGLKVLGKGMTLLKPTARRLVTYGFTGLGVSQYLTATTPEQRRAGAATAFLGGIGSLAELKALYKTPITKPRTKLTKELILKPGLDNEKIIRFEQQYGLLGRPPPSKISKFFRETPIIIKSPIKAEYVEFKRIYSPDKATVKYQIDVKVPQTKVVYERGFQKGTSTAANVFKKILGKTPRIEYLGKDRGYRIVAELTANEEQFLGQYIAFKKGPYVKTSKFGILTGKQEEISIARESDVIKKLLIRELAGKTPRELLANIKFKSRPLIDSEIIAILKQSKSLDTPISEQMAIKLLSKTAQYSGGNIRLLELGKIKLGKIPKIYARLPARKSIADILVESKEAETITRTIGGVKVTKKLTPEESEKIIEGRIISKIRGLSERQIAKGKTELLTGRTYLTYDTSGTPEDIFIIPKGEKVKVDSIIRSLSPIGRDTSLKTIQRLEPVKPKLIPAVEAKISEAKALTLGVIPKTQIKLTTLKPTSIISSTSVSATTLSQLTSLVKSEQEKEQIRQLPKEKLEPKFKLIEKPILKEIQKPTQKPLERIIQKPLERVIQKPLEKTMQKVIQKPMLKVIQKPMLKPIISLTPKIIIPKPRIPLIPVISIFPKRKERETKLIRKEPSRRRFFQLTPTITQRVYRREGKALRRKKPKRITELIGFESLRI
jgi:hypothetical protein